jgi:hypothetical protein
VRWAFWRKQQSVEALDPIAFEQFMRLQPSSIRLTEFLAWDEETRAAAVEVAEGIEAERIFALAACIQDESARNAMLRRFDAASADRSLVDSALDLAAAGVQQSGMREPAPVGRQLGRP